MVSSAIALASAARPITGRPNVTEARPMAWANPDWPAMSVQIST